MCLDRHMTQTISIISVPAEEVLVGDTLHMSHGFVGVVTELPEWEPVEVFGDTVLVGTITCEGFGAFVYATDEMRVSRTEC